MYFSRTATLHPFPWHGLFPLLSTLASAAWWKPLHQLINLSCSTPQLVKWLKNKIKTKNKTRRMLYFWDSKILPMHLNISCNHFWYFVPLVLLFKQNWHKEIVRNGGVESIKAVFLLCYPDSPSHRLQFSKLLFRWIPYWQSRKWYGGKKDSNRFGLCSQDCLGGG